MAIAPVEKICPRCQTPFLGRKNKVFCSETCKVDANNEKLKQVYHAQRGTKPIGVNKVHNVSYANKPTTNKTNYSHTENELLAHNRKLQEEIEQLKQAVKSLTAPTTNANVPTASKSIPKPKTGSKPARKATTSKSKQKALPTQSREEKLKAAKLKAAEQRKRILEMQDRVEPTPERIAKAEKQAKEMLKQLAKEENIENHPEVIQAREDAIASIRKTMADAKKKMKGKQLAEFLKQGEDAIANLRVEGRS